MLSKLERIFILAPHTDDGEFGCGGTIAKFIEEAKEIYYVAFSAAESSVPAGMPKDILRKEVKEATALLGIKPENLITFSYKVRNFPMFRQEILDDMVKLERQIKPDLVFLPSLNDTHQDHQVVTNEGFRAFKRVTMLGYEIPWNNLTFSTNCFIFIEERHLQKKIEALKCYISQLNRSYVTEGFVRNLAQIRGVQIGSQYAEVFEVIRWVLK